MGKILILCMLSLTLMGCSSIFDSSTNDLHSPCVSNSGDSKDPCGPRRIPIGNIIIS